MNPQQVVCPNLGCCARGQVGKGNVGVQRWCRRACGWAVCSVFLVALREPVGSSLSRLGGDGNHPLTPPPLSP